MKVTLEHYGHTISVDVPNDDLTIDQVRDDLLVPLLVAAGFQVENVNDLFFDEAAIVTPAVWRAHRERDRA